MQFILGIVWIGCSFVGYAEWSRVYPSPKAFTLHSVTTTCRLWTLEYHKGMQLVQHLQDKKYCPRVNKTCTLVAWSRECASQNHAFRETIVEVRE